MHWMFESVQNVHSVQGVWNSGVGGDVCRISSAINVNYCEKLDDAMPGAFVI